MARKVADVLWEMPDLSLARTLGEESKAGGIEEGLGMNRAP
jgi:hypothetical protein